MAVQVHGEVDAKPTNARRNEKAEMGSSVGRPDVETTDER